MTILYSATHVLQMSGSLNIVISLNNSLQRQQVPSFQSAGIGTSLFRSSSKRCDVSGGRDTWFRFSMDRLPTSSLGSSPTKWYSPEDQQLPIDHVHFQAVCCSVNRGTFLLFFSVYWFCEKAISLKNNIRFSKNFGNIFFIFRARSKYDTQVDRLS